MTFNYKISLNDFLTYQLYNASISERIRKKRQRNKFLIPLLYFGFCAMLLYQNQLIGGITFFCVGVSWFFVYPVWEKYRYVKHYSGFIQESHKDRIDKVVTIQIERDFIISKDDSSESKIQTTEVEEIIELPSIIMMKLKSGQAFVLPKKGIENCDELISYLKSLTKDWGVEYHEQIDWVWK